MLRVQLFKRILMLILLLRVAAERTATTSIDDENLALLRQAFEDIERQEQATRYRQTFKDTTDGNVQPATPENVLTSLSNAFPDTSNYEQRKMRPTKWQWTWHNLLYPTIQQQHQQQHQQRQQQQQQQQDENKFLLWDNSLYGNTETETKNPITRKSTVSLDTKEPQSSDEEENRSCWRWHNLNWDILSPQTTTNSDTHNNPARTVKRTPTPLGKGHAYRRSYAVGSGSAWNSDVASLMMAPRYPYAHMLTENRRNFKRQPVRENKMPPKFLPSISSGVMTNMGDFFRDLSKNVEFTRQYLLGHAETKLLDGEHPLRVLQTGLQSDETMTPEKTAQFIHALRSYRPSQKVRSLVAMNPYGYKGSQFIDPNYMWVGLGK